MENRPAAHLGELFVEHPRFGGTLAPAADHLDEPFPSFREDLGKREQLLLGHRVSDHRRAVVVALA